MNALAISLYSVLFDYAGIKYYKERRKRSRSRSLSISQRSLTSFRALPFALSSLLSLYPRIFAGTIMRFDGCVDTVSAETQIPFGSLTDKNRSDLNRPIPEVRSNNCVGTKCMFLVWINQFPFFPVLLVQSRGSSWYTKFSWKQGRIQDFSKDCYYTVSCTALSVWVNLWTPNRYTCNATKCDFRG